MVGESLESFDAYTIVPGIVLVRRERGNSEVRRGRLKDVVAWFCGSYREYINVRATMTVGKREEER